MKRSSVSALILSAALANAALAQTFSAGRAGPSVKSSISGAAGVALAPPVLKASVPLLPAALSAPSLTPVPSAPAAASPASAAPALPSLPAGVLVVRADRAEAPLTEEQLQSLRRLYQRNGLIRENLERMARQWAELGVSAWTGEIIERSRRWDRFSDVEGVEAAVERDARTREGILVGQLRLLSRLDPLEAPPRLVAETFPLMLTVGRHPKMTVDHARRLQSWLEDVEARLASSGLTLNSYLSRPGSLDALRALIADMREAGNFALWLPE
ncbi:MAG: hypothetical protein Q8T11_06640 [Elusimicrobiota bacterium]|nr:hypothetical protein [Elusimicrobiota bacterium]